MGAAMSDPVLRDHSIRMAAVLAAVDRRKTWLYAEIAAGRFPPSDRGRWDALDVEAWFAWRRACKKAGRDVGSWRDYLKIAA